MLGGERGEEQQIARIINDKCKLRARGVGFRPPARRISFSLLSAPLPALHRNSTRPLPLASDTLISILTNPALHLGTKIIDTVLKITLATFYSKCQPKLACFYTFHTA